MTYIYIYIYVVRLKKVNTNLCYTVKENVHRYYGPVSEYSGAQF